MTALKSKIEHSLKHTGTKVAIGAFLGLALLLYIVASNVAYAVSVNGELVGYAGTVDEITEAMDNAAATASGALGYEYSLESDVAYGLTLGRPDARIAAAVEETLLNDIDSIGKYAVVCVNGVPFCAFENTEDATIALSAYIARFTTPYTISARFAETVSIISDYADSALLAPAENFDESAASVLNVETVERATEYVPIPYETQRIDDETILFGDTVTECEGVEGMSRVRSEVSTLNGEPVSSVIIETMQLAAPQDAVVRYGIKERHSTGTYIWPTEGTLTSYYGYRNLEIGSKYHQGLDIAAWTGTDIFAADGGEVIYSGEMGGYGYVLMIRHDNGDTTYYAHCSKLLVKRGAIVEQGELIAYMGSTGVSTGSHLHFEIRQASGESVDPLDYLP